MSSKKLTEIDKAYIEKFCYSKSANDITKDLKKSGVVGVGVKSVEKYIDEYKTSQTQIEPAVDTEEKSIKDEVHNPSPGFDPLNLGARHPRGGVLVMTEALSEYMDEASKRNDIKDYRGKISKIRKDLPTPKGVIIDE